MQAPWLQDPDELFKRLLRVAAACSIELACGPYLATAVATLSAAEGTTPKRYVDPDSFATWLEMLPQLLGQVLAAVATTAELDETRTIESLLFILELVTRGENDDDAMALEIASGKLPLRTALAHRELARLTASLATAQEQLANAPPVRIAPATLAALDSANHIRADDVSVPIPPAAVVMTGSLSAADGDLQAFVGVPATIGELRDLYRAWAHRDGWLIEIEEGDDSHHELRFARHRHRLHLLITHGIERTPGSMIMLRLKCAGPIRYELGSAAASADGERAERVAAGPPSPPPVTRAWPAIPPAVRATPDSTDALSVIVGCSPAPPARDDWWPTHVVADRGLLYIAEDHVIWCIDPGSGRVERLVGERMAREPFDRIGGLALDARDTLVISDRDKGTVFTLDLATNQLTVIAASLVKPAAVACAGNAVYVACDDSEIHAIDRTTGAVTRLASGLPRIAALTALGTALYVADDEAVRRIDIATGTVSTVLALGRERLTGLATDGGDLYGTTYSTIDRITLSGSRETIVGAGRSGPEPDGLAEHASVTDGSAPAWDGTGIVFVARRRLRRYDAARRHVTTLAVPAHSNAPLRDTIVGIGSLGGTRIALAFRKPPAIAVIDYASGARDDIVLDAASDLQALATDGRDRVFVTDRDGHTWCAAAQARAVSRIDAIAAEDKPAALAFAEPDRLFVALTTPGTVVAIDLARSECRTVATGMQSTRALAFDVPRGALYISDSQIMRVDLASGETTALTDAKLAGSLDGPKGVARFLGRDHIAVAPDGDVYLSSHTAIRQIRAADGYVTTPVGRRESGLVLGELPGGLEQPTALCFLPSGELAIVDRTQNIVLRARL